MNRLQARLLPDGQRLHLSDGPIDLVIEAWGADRHRAYDAAIAAAQPVLDALCAERPALSASQPGPPLHGPVASAMQRAVAPHAGAFITPMAAVAGAVADHVLSAMVGAAAPTRAYVNNGGDIALHLAPGEAFDAAIAGLDGAVLGTVRLRGADGVRGIATSGWPGRSFSLGIADSVTVLAATAAGADAAATVIANAVDLPGHPAIVRVPANALQPGSDLGRRLVTRAVAPLSPQDRRAALAAGAVVARCLVRAGLIAGAALHLQGETVVDATRGLRIET